MSIPRNLSFLAENASSTGVLAVVGGGTGTATPSIVAGTNVTVTGTWPNQTIAASGGGGGSTITISNKTAAYTVVAGDLATVINCTSGTFTVSLTAAATLGSGFNVTIWNTGTGVITIDPSGSETIDGTATRILRRGEGMQVVCDGTNWQTGDKKTMRGYAENLSSTDVRPIASGSASTAIGNDPGGTGVVASGLNSLAIQGNATAQNCVAIGANSGDGRSQAVTGIAAMALGGSYASGADSFAAAIANNTSTYGATGSNSIAIGANASTNATYGTVLGGFGNTATASWGISLGGRSCTAGFNYSIALGYLGVPNAIGKMTFGHAGGLIGTGGLGWGKLNLYAATTDATATVLTSSGSATPDTTNQLIVLNNSAYSFTGTVVARQKAANGTASAAWKVEGLIRREANAGTTTLVFSLVTAISNVPLWTLALSADTTNGGLAITATGAAATNIRWIATIDTSEVIYA